LLSFSGLLVPFLYWQGWVFLATFATSTVGFTVYLAIYDKPLLERRLKAGPQHEKERSQKLIVSLVFVSFFALIILPALDHRFGCSPVAPWVSLLGDVIIALSAGGAFDKLRGMVRECEKVTARFDHDHFSK
jgi:hypothetical protein